MADGERVVLMGYIVGHKVGAKMESGTIYVGTIWRVVGRYLYIDIEGDSIGFVIDTKVDNIKPVCKSSEISYV
jgi:formylmethanofuran dehydrogenase subunit C